jgi:hypothetical protein
MSWHIFREVRRHCASVDKSLFEEQETFYLSKHPPTIKITVHAISSCLLHDSNYSFMTIALLKCDNFKKR